MIVSSGGSKYNQPSKNHERKKEISRHTEKTKQRKTFRHKPESAVQRSHVLINQTFQKSPEYCQHSSGNQKLIYAYVTIILGQGSCVDFQEQAHKK